MMHNHVFSAGIFFVPTPEELINYFLARRIQGDPTGGALPGSIHEADIYGCSPDKLTATVDASNGFGEWFFFCHCSRQSHGSKKMNRRDAEGGTWLLQQGKKPVKMGSLVIGYHQNFGYVAKNGRKTDWLMTEYHADSEEATEDKVLVICKIYKTPRAHDLRGPSMICSKRSAAEEEISAESSAPKRPRMASLPWPAVGETSGAHDDDFACFLESNLLADDDAAAVGDTSGAQHEKDARLAFLESTLLADDDAAAVGETSGGQHETDANVAHDDDFAGFLESTLLPDDDAAAPEAPSTQCDPVLEPVISSGMEAPSTSPQDRFLQTSEGTAHIQQLLSNLMSLLPPSVSATERQDFYHGACGVVSQTGGFEGDGSMQPSWLPPMQQISY